MRTIKILQGRWCASPKIMGGSHHQLDFQPAAFVSSLQGVGLPNIGFDGRTAKFCRPPGFEFFNSIGQKQTSISALVIFRSRSEIRDELVECAVSTLTVVVAVGRAAEALQGEFCLTPVLVQRDN